MTEADIFVFAGAGASAPLPSNLPVFAPIRRAIGVSLKLNSDLPLEDILASFAPETILEFLSRAGAKTDRMMQGLFSGREPNGVHDAIAQLIKFGSIAWTPNVDELIESADSSIAWNEVRYIRGSKAPPLIGHRLVKPHGSISKPESFRFFASQVNRKLDGELNELLARHATNKDVMIIGYAGLDPDLAGGLRMAIELANSAVWWDFPDRAAEISGRYRSFVPMKLEVRASMNPALAFVEEIELRSRKVHVQEELRDQLETVCGPPAVDLHEFKLDTYHYAAGKILEVSGSQNFRSRYLTGAFAGPLRQRFLSGGCFIAADLYDERRRVVRAGIAGVAAASETMRKISSGRCSFAVAEVGNLRLLEREGNLDSSLRSARQLAEVRSDDPRFLLDAAAIERKSGSPLLAETYAHRAFETIERLGDNGVIACRAQFEIAEIGRITGNNGMAREVATRLLETGGIFGGPRWTRWAQYEIASLELLEGHSHSAALSFHEGADWFKKRSTPVAMVIHMLAESGALRIVGDFATALAVVNGAARVLEGLPNPHQGLRDWLGFERIEIERGCGNTKDVSYETLARSSLVCVKMMARLQQLLDSRFQREDLVRIEEECRTMGYWFPAEVARERLSPGSSGIQYFQSWGWMNSSQLAFP